MPFIIQTALEQSTRFGSTQNLHIEIHLLARNLGSSRSNFLDVHEANALLLAVIHASGSMGGRSHHASWSTAEPFHSRGSWRPPCYLPRLSWCSCGLSRHLPAVQNDTIRERCMESPLKHCRVKKLVLSDLASSHQIYIAIHDTPPYVINRAFRISSAKKRSIHGSVAVVAVQVWSRSPRQTMYENDAATQLSEFHQGMIESL